jgi:hypothetical protein
MRGFWKSKPPAGVGISYGHPLGQGLAACWLWDEGSSAVKMGARSCSDRVRNLKATLSANFFLRSTSLGTALDCAETGNATVTIPVLASGTTFTIEQWWYFRSIPGGIYSGLLNATGGSLGLYMDNTGKLNYFFTGLNHNGNTVLTTLRWHHIGVSVSGGSGVFYLNGRPDGTMISVPTMNWNNIGADTVGNDADGWNLLTRLWIGRALTASDFAALYADPYDMFLPPVWRRSFVASDVIPPESVSYTRLERFHPRGMDRGVFP